MFTNAIRYHRDHHQDHDDQDHLVVVLVEKEFLMVALLLVFFQGLARQKRQ